MMIIRDITLTIPNNYTPEYYLIKKSRSGVEKFKGIWLEFVSMVTDESTTLSIGITFT